MDVKEIKEILRILEEQDVTEFELEQDGTKLRICRGQRAPEGQPKLQKPVLFFALLGRDVRETLFADLPHELRHYPPVS